MTEKKKKIAIVTHHRACNYGAVLQAYATVRYFEDKGYDAIVVDYVPKYLQGFGSFTNTFNQIDNRKHGIVKRVVYSILKTPSNKKMKVVFYKFVDKYIPLTRRYYGIDEMKNNKPIADYYCSGSDQIWNNYYTGCFDDVYFLDFAEKKDNCISLASSFGREDFDKNEMNIICAKLKKYSAISVREAGAEKMLSRNGIKDAIVTYDPTLLVDEKIWKKIASKKNSNKKYILVYQLHGDSDVYKQAKRFAKQNKMQIVRIITMYHQIRIGEKNIVMPTVEDFLSLINNAEYVFTDSFHGTIFSLLFEKKVAVRLPVRFNGRIKSLLQSIGATAIIADDINKWQKNVTEAFMKKAHEKIKKNADANRFLYERTVLGE